MEPRDGFFDEMFGSGGGAVRAPYRAYDEWFSAEEPRRLLAKSAEAEGYDAQLLNAVEDVNNRQKHRVFQKISEHYGGELDGKTIALWGLSFKPRTDDMREAPSRVLMEALWDAGARVRAYDPEALEEADRLYPEEATTRHSPDLH